VPSHALYQYKQEYPTIRIEKALLFLVSLRDAILLKVQPNFPKNHPPSHFWEPVYENEGGGRAWRKKRLYSSRHCQREREGGGGNGGVAAKRSHRHERGKA